MVSKKTRFNCQPDTSSVFRQRVLQALFHDGFWKSDHSFLTVVPSNFYQRCNASEILMLHWRLHMTSWWYNHQWGLRAIFPDRFRKGDYDFRIVIHSNFLSAMQGFRDNEVLLPTGYDVIVGVSPGSASGDFWWLIPQKRPWLSDSVHSFFNKIASMADVYHATHTYEGKPKVAGYESGSRFVNKTEPISVSKGLTTPATNVNRFIPEKKIFTG